MSSQTKREVSVIRLSERAYRDLRITTHCCLVTRAFGGKRIFLDSEVDAGIGKTVENINKEFGGDFRVEYEKNLYGKIKQLKKEGNVIVHLTMYGQAPVNTVMTKLKKAKKVTIVIGSEKVPGDVYHTADYNISITRQPHSEVASLAVFMHRLNEGKEEKMEFEGARKKVVPMEHGKRVERVNGLNG